MLSLTACTIETKPALSPLAADRPSARLLARGEFVVRSAHVLTMDPPLGDVKRGDIHVRAGQIVAMGKNLQRSGVEVIGGGQMIALPGLIDTHSHLWNTPLRN